MSRIPRRGEPARVPVLHDAAQPGQVFDGGQLDVEP